MALREEEWEESLLYLCQTKNNKRKKRKCLLGCQLMLVGLTVVKIGQIPPWLQQKRNQGHQESPGWLPLAVLCLLFQTDPCPTWQELTRQMSFSLCFGPDVQLP